MMTQVPIYIGRKGIIRFYHSPTAGLQKPCACFAVSRAGVFVLICFVRVWVGIGTRLVDM